MRRNQSSCLELQLKSMYRLPSALFVGLKHFHNRFFHRLEKMESCLLGKSTLDSRQKAKKGIKGSCKNRSGWTKITVRHQREPLPRSYRLNLLLIDGRLD